MWHQGVTRGEDPIAWTPPDIGERSKIKTLNRDPGKQKKEGVFQKQMAGKEISSTRGFKGKQKTNPSGLG